MRRTRASILPPTGTRHRAQSGAWGIAGGVAGLALLTALIAACGESSAPDSNARTAEAAREEPAAERTEPPEKPRPESLDPILEVLREPDAFTRAAKLATLLPTLDAVAGRNVHLLLRDPTLGLGSVEHALLVRFWSQHAPEEAARWALFHSPQLRRGAAIEIAFTRFAGEDPEAAVEDLRSFMATPGPFLRDAEIALVRGWFASGKPGLVDYIRGLGVGFERQRAVAAYALELAERDGVEAAIAWADSVEVDEDDPAFKKAALRQTASAVAMTDPLAAAAWCDRVCEEEIATNMRAMVAQRWAARDGRAAMEWVADAPAGKERDWAARSAFWGWWRNDREGFESWIATAAADEVPLWLDNAVEVYAAQLAGRGNFRKGIEFGQRMVDEKTRIRTLMNVARIWHKADPQAADAWLETSELSEEDRDRVRNPRPGREVRPVEEDGDEEE